MTSTTSRVRFPSVQIGEFNAIRTNTAPGLFAERFFQA